MANRLRLGLATLGLAALTSCETLDWLLCKEEPPAVVQETGKRDVKPIASNVREAIDLFDKKNYLAAAQKLSSAREGYILDRACLDELQAELADLTTSARYNDAQAKFDKYKTLRPEFPKLLAFTAELQGDYVKAGNYHSAAINTAPSDQSLYDGLVDDHSRRHALGDLAESGWTGEKEFRLCDAIDAHLGDTPATAVAAEESSKVLRLFSMLARHYAGTEKAAKYESLAQR